VVLIVYHSYVNAKITLQRKRRREMELPEDPMVATSPILHITV